MALLSSEKKFKNLSESAQVAIAILSEPPEGRFLYVNPYWENLTGYSSKDAEKLKAKDLVAPEFHKVLTKETINRLSMGKASDKTEFRLITKSGEVKWIKFTATMIDFDGENAILRTGLDITAQKNAEHELLLAKENAERSENYLDSIINNIGDPVFVKDEESKFLLVNEAFCSFLDLTRENIIGKTLAEDIPPKEQEIFLKIDRQVLETGKENINEETLTMSGQEMKIIRTRKTRYIDNDGKKHLIGVIRDITDRKNAEEELKKAQEIARLGSWYLDVSTGEISWSDELYKMYGFDPSFPIPPYSEHEKYFTPESWELLNSSIEHTRDTGIPYSIELKTNQNTEDGSWQWMFAHGEAIFDSENNIIALRGIAQDITENKLAELILKESEEKYRTLFEQSLIGIGMARGNEVVFGNKAMMAIWKYDSLEEYKKKPLIEHIAPDYRELIQNRIKEGLANKGKNLPAEYEYDIICRDGEIKNVRGHTSYMQIGDEIYSQTVVMDVTERIKAEEDLLETLSRLNLAVKTAKLGVWSRDAETDELIWNDRLFEIYGSSPDEFESNMDSYFDRLHPDDLDYINEVLGSLYEGEPLHDVKFRIIRPDNEIRYIDSSAAPLVVDGRIEKYIGINRDITEQKIAEDNLKETFAQLELAVDTAKLGVWTHDIITDELTWNNELFEIFGIAPSEFGLNFDAFKKLVHPEDLDYVLKEQEKVFRNKAVSGIHYRIIRSNNEVRYIYASATPVFDQEKNLIKIIGINLDITEDKKAEKKLAQANLELIDAVSSLNELKKQLEDQNVYLKKELDLVFNFEEMVYGSAAFSQVLTDLERVAPTDASVLILGESGTGKELLARALHNLSLRKNKPLIKVNCSAIPSELIESEFFGHKKGSFTGAVSDKIGKFELADGGTLFLDEIGDLPLAMQPKLLRFLQEGEMEVVGGTTTRSLDVRIVAATNKDLKKEVEKDQFREDLYFRLNVFPIDVPALRDRKEDIPLLVEHFSNKFGKKYRKNVKYISDSAMQNLRKHSWPGNIRELENLIERSVILSDSEFLNLQGFDSKNSKKGRPISSSANITLNEVQRNHILSVLEKTNWKIDGPDGAALILDIKPSTFRDKMKKLGIKRSNP